VVGHALAALAERELRLEPLDRFAHALVVERDPVARQPADAVPVAAFVARLGLLGNIAGEPEVAIEAGEDRLRNRRRAVGAALGGVPVGALRVHEKRVRVGLNGVRGYLVSANSSRPISIRRISEVPAPIS